MAEMSSLVRPAVPVPLKIQRMTGISQGAVDAAPEFEEISAELAGFLGDKPLIAHNADFDAAFITAAMTRCGQRAPANNRYDTLDLARLVRPSLKSFRLERLAASEGIPVTRAHDALEDARTAGLVFLSLFERLCGFEPALLDQIASFARLSKWAISDVLDEAVSLSVAGRMRGDGRAAAGGDRGGVAAAGAAVFQEAGARGAMRRSEGEYTPVPYDVVRDALGEGGRLHRMMDSYEFRPQQLQMGYLVAEALSDGKHLLAEAGTGIGKSIAYLVPAAAFAYANRTRVVVSTHTINLQEQLWSKDIPLVKDKLGLHFEHALLKGKSNYLCLRRWKALSRRAPALPADDLRLLARTAVWVRETLTGDKSELGLLPDQEPFWDLVSSDPDSCDGRGCPECGSCFFQKAREAASRADLIVVNHSLVFSDLASGNKVLPEYAHIVFDEAHHLEKVASEHLGDSVSTYDLDRLLAVQNRNGLLDRAERVLRAEGAAGAADAGLIESFSTARDAARRARSDLQSILDGVRGLQVGGGSGGEEGEQFPRAVGITPALAQAGLGPFLGMAAALAGSLDEAAAAVSRLWGLTSESRARVAQSGPRADDADDLEIELKRVVARLGSAARVIGEVSSPRDDGLVRWIEVDKGERPRVVFRLAPVHVGESLREPVFERLRSVIMTSATLTVGGSFDYFKHRLGLDVQPQERLISESIGSPFDYARQALVYVPAGIPNPRSGENGFCRAIEPLLCRLAEASGGRMLVLFTSHRMLRAVYHRVKSRLEASGICLLGQGIDGSRSRLLEEFREDGGTVLFGSQSFWEGIDVVGPALSCVVLVKLPFSPPNQPLLEARAERLAREGLDPFLHLLVPEAVLRFKQGFGRLIRSKTDRGVVAVFDRRVLPGESTYGRRFLESLPGPSVASGDEEELIEKLREWLPQDGV